MSKIMVRVSPSGDRMEIVEDGQIDLEALPFGKVVSRRRVGLINPAIKTPTRLEVTMLDDGSVLEGEFRTKGEAVEAEQDEVRRRMVEEAEARASAPGRMEATEKRSETQSPPSTGPSQARCPRCQIPLHLAYVNRGGSAGVEFRCRCPAGR